MTFCTACGRPRSGAAQFCTSCGAPFPGAAGQAPGEGGPADTTPVPPHVAPGPPGGPVTEPVGPGWAPAPPAAPRGPGDAGADAAGGPSGDAAGAGDQLAGAETADDPFAVLFGPRERPPDPPPPAYTGVDQYYPEPPRSYPEPPRSYPEPPRSYPEPPEPPRPRPTKIIAIGAAVLAVLAAGGGVAAWALSRPAAHSSAHGTRTSGVHASTPPSTPAQPSSSPPVSPRPRRTRLVTVGPGVPRHGGTPGVVAFLNSYFTAINNHDYQQYQALLDPQVQQQETAARFAAGYRGSHDSAATLTGLTGSGAQVAASVSFTSHQPAAVSPSHTGCTRWNITLFLTPNGGSYLIGTPPQGYQAVYQAC